MHPEQKKAFQKMTPEQKLGLAFRLYCSAQKLKFAALQQDHPNWSEEEIKEKVREIFLYART